MQATMQHQHTEKVLEWGLDAGSNNWYAKLYGCTDCTDTFTNVAIPTPEEPHSHAEYVDGCFACKVATLQINTGDAGRVNSMPQKKWDKELDRYAGARAQGVQPAGTTTRAINAAMDASETLGKAYNADTMIPAQNMTKKHAEHITTIGA